MAKSMKNNKAIKMLKAAEEGGYGVIGVVSVPLYFLSSLPPTVSFYENSKLTILTDLVQPRDHNRRHARCRKETLSGSNPPLPLGITLLPSPDPSRRSSMFHGDCPDLITYGPCAV